MNTDQTARRPGLNHSNQARLHMAAIAAGLLAAGVGALQAQPITVPNYSFESPTAPTTYPYVNTTIDSWQKIAEPAYYEPAFGSYGITWDQTAGVFYDTNPYANKDGSQLAYILAAPQVTLYQNLSATFQAGESYNMTVGVFGQSSLVAGATLELSLYYLANGNEVTVGSTTINYSAGVFNVNATPLNLVDFTASTGPIAPGNAAVGQNIGIQIESTVPLGPAANLGNWDIDNVRLNASVPEPATMSLLALGVGGWFLSRARRRA
jgi:hypothetical protein